MKLLACCLALALGACGSKSSSTTPSAMAPSPKKAPWAASRDADDPSCPLLVPGTSISVDYTERGAALMFVTTGDPLAVRARVAKLAEMHNKHDGPPSAMGMMFPKDSEAIAMDIEGGARVEFQAMLPNQVVPLQEELKMHASHLTGGTCEM